MLGSNPRVGEIKLEEIVDRSIVRKLDDRGFIDRLYNVYSAKRSCLGESSCEVAPMNAPHEHEHDSSWTTTHGCEQPELVDLVNSVIAPYLLPL